MRRLTLILSDLYLPADAARESFPTTLQLPALQWLLRFATTARRIGDWRSWLARELGANAVADWPVAHVCARAATLPVEGMWMATPVALEARLDHVRLRDRGLIHLPVAQQHALRHEFTKVFGDALGLRTEGHLSLMLQGGPEVDIVTQDPARILDADIGAALPSGSVPAGELRRLGTEIEMWLHSSAVNAARERARQPRISALWLWGGGAARAKPPGPAIYSQFVERPQFRLSGGDSYVAALHQLSGRQTLQPVPESFVPDDEDSSTFVQMAPMSGTPGESLSALEQNWFTPIRHALSAGTLTSFRLVANDRLFEVAARPGWRLWRQRRTWLESLA